MKKITLFTLAIFITFTTNCFANQIDLTDVKWVEKIVQQMAQSNELDKKCVKKFKNRITEIVTISGAPLLASGVDGEVFLIESNPNGPCYNGNRTGAIWLYKKKDKQDNLSKIFGPKYPALIKPMESYTREGLKGLEVTYPAGNSYPPTSELYIFNGKKYELFKK